MGYVHHNTYLTTESYNIDLHATAAWILFIDLLLADNKNNNNGDDDVPVTKITKTTVAMHSKVTTPKNSIKRIFVINFADATDFHTV